MTSAYDQGVIPPIEIRHRLRIAREAAGLDQEQLAALIGVGRNTIGNIEKNKLKTPPRRIVVNAWALACGVPVTWVLTGGEPDDPGPGDGGGQQDPDPPQLLGGSKRRPAKPTGVAA